METFNTPWQTFLSQISKPHRVLQGVVEYSSAWIFTRPWGAFLLFSPILIVVVAATSLAAYGIWLDPRDLTTSYLEQAEAEIESLEEQAEAGAEFSETEAMQEEKVSPRGELLLRRVLQLEESNSRAKFLVGLRIAQSGRNGQARRMMRELAPENAEGYAPAHAWLAIDQFNQGISDREALDQIGRDLKTAQGWSGIGVPLVAAYADLLAEQGKSGEAEAVIESAISSGRPGAEALELKLANLAYKSGKRKTLSATSQKVKDRVREKMEAEEASVDDYVGLGNIFLLEIDPNRALETARRGLERYSGDKKLVRIASEALRMKYLLQLQESRGKSVNLGLLDAALKMDPTNPAVSQEVARLLAFGKEASEDLVAQLRKQIAGGETTALTHILLADREFTERRVEKAVAHLEVALRQAPGNPTVLNNLGLCLALIETPDLSRSQELIGEAVARVPDSAEYWDSLGTVRGLSGDQPGTVEALEQAIRLDPKRIGTRQKLMDAFQKMGLDEMVELQREEIRKLEDAANESGDSESSAAGEPGEADSEPAKATPPKEEASDTL